MENVMVINAFAIGLTPEEAIAPQSLFGWLKSKITDASKVPSHIYAITKISLDAATE